MNSFMRSVSILLGATIISWSGVSYAKLTAAQCAAKQARIDAGNTTETMDVADKCTPTTEVDPASIRDTTPAANNNAASNNQDQGGGGGQPQQPAQNQQQQQGQQPDQAQKEQPSSSADSGFCGDTDPDVTGKSANASVVPGNSKATEKPGKGLKEACQKISDNFAQKAQQANSSGKSLGLSGTNFEALQKDFEEYKKNREDCMNGQSSAATMCMEDLSPDMAGTASGVNNILGQVGQNASDTCGKFAKAMELAKAGLTAFTGNCGAAQGSCSSSCSKATSGLSKLVAKAKTATSTAKCSKPELEAQCQPILQQYKAALEEGIAGASEENSSSTDTSMAQKQKACQGKYAANMGSALQGIMGMVAGLMQGNKCEKETDGTAEQLGTVNDKCILPENAALPECICKANPRTVGCANAYDKISSNAAGQVAGGLTDKANVDPNRGVAGLDSKGEMASLPQSPGSDSGAPIGGGAGGPGIGGGSGGGGGGLGGGAGEGGAKGLNANILGGTGGGGGGAGGGAWGGGAGDKYRAYLPGGAKDPAKAMAGEQAWKNEVTGQGGKSNWEKVKDRYIDNKKSLLNN